VKVSGAAEKGDSLHLARGSDALPPHAAIPELNLTDWQQLKSLSQKERDLILKVSASRKMRGRARRFSRQRLVAGGLERGGGRSAENFETSPSVLQRFHKPSIVEANWFDLRKTSCADERPRRLCPYYFVSATATRRAAARGVLATIVPADKKIVHACGRGAGAVLRMSFIF